MSLSPMEFCVGWFQKLSKDREADTEKLSEEQLSLSHPAWVLANSNEFLQINSQIF